jgi:thioredoxin 2
LYDQIAHFESCGFIFGTVDAQAVNHPGQVAGFDPLQRLACLVQRSVSDMREILCPRCGCVNRMPEDRPAGAAKCGACHERLFDGHPTVVDAAGFDKHLRVNDIPVLVDMWAPWCGPCRTMAPMFEKAAQTLEPYLGLLKLNVDEAQDLAARYGVSGIPALLLFQNGRVIAQQAGAQSAEAIVRWVRSHVPVSTPSPGD